MAEDKKARFIRIAERRTQAVIDALRSLSNCANTVSYSYTPEQVSEIFNAIEEETILARSRFEGKKHFTLTEHS